MAKKCFVVLVLFCFVSTLIFAQSSSQVDTWLSTAESRSSRAYTLAKQDASGNVDTIFSLLEDVRGYLERVQDYIASGNMLTSRQEQRLQRIVENMNSAIQLTVR